MAGRDFVKPESQDRGWGLPVISHQSSDGMLAILSSRLCCLSVRECIRSQDVLLMGSAAAAAGWPGDADEAHAHGIGGAAWMNPGMKPGIRSLSKNA